MERGEFDNLPGKGKPLGDLGSLDDRDWWLKKLIERERITGVLPAALQLRKDDAELDALLDREATEKLVREQVEDFNRRIVEARRQLQGGPPVVTRTRDVDAEVERWRERRRERHLRRRADAERAEAERRAGTREVASPLVPAHDLTRGSVLRGRRPPAPATAARSWWRWSPRNSRDIRLADDDPTTSTSSLCQVSASRASDQLRPVATAVSTRVGRGLAERGHRLVLLGRACAAT